MLFRSSAATINKTITRLGQVLEVAVERRIVEYNAARGARRKVAVTKRPAVYLTNAAHIQTVLDAAGELDANPRSKTSGRRALVATLVFAGLRSGELCDLRRRDLDLEHKRITVRQSKTEQGRREVDLLPALERELTVYLDSVPRTLTPNQHLFQTRAGTPRDPDNVRFRVFNPVVKRAKELAAKRELAELPKGLTPHKLRHTFASILTALGDDSAYVRQQLGHTDSAFTLDVYTHVMGRREGERQALRDLVGERDG